MSLDISLYENLEPKIKAWEARKAESIKEAGSMVALIPMIEEYYEKRKPSFQEEYYECNITHNLTVMADAAGLYNYLWGIDKLDTKIALPLIEPLKRGLGKLKSDPEYFRTFNAANGWGTYKQFVPFVEKFLNACIEYPHAVVIISK